MCDLGGGCREEIGWEGVVTRQGGRQRGRRGDCYNSDARAWCYLRAKLMRMSHSCLIGQDLNRQVLQ